MKNNIKKKYFILSGFLLLISIIIILIYGNTYTLTVKVDDVKDIEKLNIEVIQDSKIISITNKELTKENLKIKIKPHKKGKAWVTVYDNEENYYCYNSIYVHNFGVITNESFFGKTRGDFVIPISILILLIVTIKIFIDKYRVSVKKNLYQYKNIYYLGIIIFLVFSTIMYFFMTLKNNGIIDIIKKTLNLTKSFSYYVLPIAFITSILITISNIVLVKKEGFSPKRLLGLVLGLLICLLTITPEILSNYLQTATWIDVHRENGIALYLEIFVETFISSIATYLECVLISTIILSIKAAKKIPKFNKDYIIILGCKINKDGSLTNLLKQRVDRAIEFSKLQKEKTNKDIIFIPSGGKGNDEVIPESHAIKKYLLKNNIKEENIIVEDKSKNTYENIKYSIEKIKAKKNIAFSTTNYHVFRAGVIASNQNINIEGIGSKTKTYFWINAFIREFVATLYNEKKKHLIAIAQITIFTIMMIIITYLSVVL